MIRSREDLRSSKRVVIKAGTSIVSTPEGFPSLSRIAAIVEQVNHFTPHCHQQQHGQAAAQITRALRVLFQVAFLKLQGKDVLVVTSGAVGVGRQARCHDSCMTTFQTHNFAFSASSVRRFFGRACAQLSSFSANL
jgi:glutamate 5-kinase